ncbi:hypothetical protein [Microbacterium galbinum]|uniref:Uncharacterized protein n=1 Tax=Microbacterium galbinum TaxID=2851646 RepID=A0ABY4ISD8_9MICO|nr:hypothetical protein [Microbacterium galbinum]UPL15692.1 hypothetical protein KV396_14920 [Microbacterium galbinum]
MTLSATGATLAVVGGAVAGIALGARRSGVGLSFLGVWATGLLLSMVSIAVLEWAPLRLSITALGGVIVTAAVTAGILAFIRRPQYRRAISTTGTSTGALALPGVTASSI